MLSRVTAYDWMGSLALLPIGYVLAGPLGERLERWEASIRVPQLSQKRASGRAVTPHEPHTWASAAPQLSQNDAPSRFGCWHLGQTMRPPAVPLLEDHRR